VEEGGCDVFSNDISIWS